MAKKLFLNRERAIPVVHAPSVIREEPDSGMPSTSRNNSVRNNKRANLLNSGGDFKIVSEI